MLPVTRHPVNLKCGPWHKPRRWSPITRDTRKCIKSKYNEDLIFGFDTIKSLLCSIMRNTGLYVKYMQYMNIRICSII